MRKAAEGHLTTEALMWNQNNQKTISGMSSEDFRLVSVVAAALFYPCQSMVYGVIIFYLAKFPPCRVILLKIESSRPNNAKLSWMRTRDKIIKYFPIH